MRYITCYSLIFLVCKQVEEHEKNKWKIGLYSYEYYYVYRFLYSRLDSK